MKPPYEITSEIIALIGSISEKIGSINTLFLHVPNPSLRKQNRIKTIHASLKIEGNTLSEEQVTSILEGKPVFGPVNDILEVKNAISAYEQLDSFSFVDERSFLLAHKLLMNELTKDAGKYRTGNVGIAKAEEIQHIAPPAVQVPTLMNSLFDYLKNDTEISLIKSCVFHYELEFIHPFSDGNGRMGRLWQNVILAHQHKIFNSLPIESIIASKQEDYYKVLSECDKQGKSTLFIAFMLDIINQGLAQILNVKSVLKTQEERISQFLELHQKPFSRKDYMNEFKTLSTATASRDLQKAVELNLIQKIGDKNKAFYQITPRPPSA